MDDFVISDNYRHFTEDLKNNAKNGEPVLAQLMHSEEKKVSCTVGDWHGTQTIYYPEVTVVIGRVANNMHDTRRVRLGGEYNIVFAECVFDLESGEEYNNYRLRQMMPESTFSSQKAELGVVRVADYMELARHIEMNNEEFRARFTKKGGYRLNWEMPGWKVPAMILYLNTDAISQYALNRYGAANIHPIFRELKMELPRNKHTTAVRDTAETV